MVQGGSDTMCPPFFQKAISQWKKGSGGSKFLDLKESHNTLGLHMNVLNMFGVTIKDIDEGGGELAIRKIFVISSNIHQQNCFDSSLSMKINFKITTNLTNYKLNIIEFENNIKRITFNLFLIFWPSYIIRTQHTAIKCFFILFPLSQKNSPQFLLTSKEIIIEQWKTAVEKWPCLEFFNDF